MWNYVPSVQSRSIFRGPRQVTTATGLSLHFLSGPVKNLFRITSWKTRCLRSNWREYNKTRTNFTVRHFRRNPAPPHVNKTMGHAYFLGYRRNTFQRKSTMYSIYFTVFFTRKIFRFSATTNNSKKCSPSFDARTHNNIIVINHRTVMLYTCKIVWPLLLCVRSVALQSPEHYIKIIDSG